MSEDPREALLDVARDIVAKRGYMGLTMRTASAAVGVTPDVARRYFRNREALFAAAMRLPADPVSAIPTLMAPGIEGMGERLVRFTLDTLRDPEARNDLMSLARTGVAAGHAVTALQDFIEVDVVDRVATLIGVPDARMRSALITSYLLGVATMRYGVRLEPLASASDEEVIRMVAPVIQDLLDPRRPIPGSARARLEQSTEVREQVPPHLAAAGKRTFDPDPAATRARQAARLAAEAAHARAGTEQEPRRHAAGQGAALRPESAATRVRRKPVAEPAAGRPAPGKPAAGKASARKPAATKPAATKPAAAKPAAAKPATKPAAAKPAPVEPAATKPATSEPADTRRTGAKRPAQPAGTSPAGAKSGAPTSGIAKPATPKAAPKQPSGRKPAPAEPQPAAPDAGDPSAQADS